MPAMHSRARSGSPDAGEKADALLRKMELLSRMEKYEYRIHPDTISFNTCIKAWCNSGLPNSPLKAEEVLTKLETNPQYPIRTGGGKAIGFLSTLFLLQTDNVH
jgi:hypothetical protein